jgi:hypothetical protein
MTSARALAREDKSQKIISRIPDIQKHMSDGIAFGSLCEWGVPPGQMSLQVLLSFLTPTEEFDSSLILWVNNQAELQVYPPAWQQQGLDLKRLFFINMGQSDESKKKKKKAVTEALKPIFLEDVFSIIVLHDLHLTRTDMAFLHKQAKRFRKIIFVVYSRLLSHKIGNVWAKWRFNSWRDNPTGPSHFQALKGPQTFHLKIRSGKYEDVISLS